MSWYLKRDDILTFRRLNKCQIETLILIVVDKSLENYSRISLEYHHVALEPSQKDIISNDF